jgi:hypothetical protein
MIKKIGARVEILKFPVNMHICNEKFFSQGFQINFSVILATFALNFGSL